MNLNTLPVLIYLIFVTTLIMQVLFFPPFLWLGNLRLKEVKHFTGLQSYYISEPRLKSDHSNFKAHDHNF